MRLITKSILMLLLCTLGVLTTQAKTEKVHATFENPSNTSATWNAADSSFTWPQTSYNQIRNIGLPTGDITKYKKLVVDCKVRTGSNFRILVYKGGSNLTLWAKDGVNEFILADTLKAVSPDDYNSYLKDCGEICLSGSNAYAPGEVKINDIYLETYDDEGEKVFATFAGPTNTSATWNAADSSFTWPQTSYNQIRNIGLPTGDISKYKKLVVDCKVRTGSNFRILVYKGGSNLTLWAKDGVNEFILADTLKAVSPDDYNSYLKECSEICLSGSNAYAPGEVKINSIYLETYPENESVEIPDIVYEEDPGKPEGEFIDFTEVFSTLQPRLGLGTDGHPIVLGNGDVVVGQRTKDVIADLSEYSKLTMVTSPNLKLVVYMNHEIDARQNAGEYTEDEAGKYVFLDVQANENGIAEVDLTQFDKQDLNCICLPWDNSNKGTVWYLLLTAKPTVAEDVLPIDIQFGADYNEKSISNYTSTWTATKDGKTWSLVNFNNNQNKWNSVKCGRKDNKSVASITSPAIDAVVKNYVISLAGAANVNSAKLAIMNGEQKVGDDIDITEKFVAGEVNVPVEGQKGYSYVLTIDNASASANGSVEITKVTLYGEGQYVEVEPVHIANTAETAYDVAKAIELIEAGEALTDSVFVKGIISKIEKVNIDAEDATKSYITYWISADGSEEGQQFECYKGLSMEGLALDAIEVGAEVIVKGTLKKYGDIYELNSGNLLVSYKAPEAPATPTFTPAAGEYFAAQTVTIACETEGAAIYYTLDGTAPTAESALYAEPIAIAQTTTVKAIAIKDGVASEVAEATFTITEPLFADGKYYIYNVGAKKFLAAGSSWGTHAVVNETGLDYIVAFANGKYTLDSQVSNGGNNHFLNGEWNDGGAMGWIFAPVEGKEGVYTISNGTQFLTAGEDGRVTLAADATVETAQWTLTTLEARIAELATATSEAPVNATFLIQDANFGRNDLRKSAWKMEAANQNLSGGEDGNGSVGNNCAESYHSTFALSQVIANAPAGKYKMTAQGFYRQDGSDNDNLPVFYANDKTGTFPLKTGSEGSMTDASKSFTAGNYTIEPIEFTVFEDGQLTIGAKLENNTNLWCIWDNFQLTYVTKDIPADEFEPAYTAALAAAKAAKDNESYAAVTGEEKTALEKAISDYETIAEPSADTYKAAISALTNATTAFTAAKADYEALTAAKAAKAEFGFAAYPYAAAAKKAAAEETLTAEATSAADAKAKTEAIDKAFRLFVESNALLEGTEGAKNCTDSIKNPNAVEAIAAPWVVVKGEGSGGSLNILDGEPLTDGEGNSAYKYFDGGNWGANAWDVALEQKIALPAGKYYLTVAGRASADVELKLYAGKDSVKMDAVGASGALFGRGWNDASVEFELAEADSIVIGVRGVTSVVHNWMSFTRFRLMKFASAEDIALLNAINALKAIIATDKTIATEDQQGAEAFAAAITAAETAADAADATIESIAAARAALASAVSAFVKANIGEDFAEIAQDQGKTLDSFTRTELVEGEDYNTYTAGGDLNIAIKMMNVDVKDCDYLVVKFAEPVAAGWHLAFWSNQDLVDVPAGVTEFKYVFADDPKCGVSAEGVLPQICMMTFFGGFQAPLEAKIIGIYKHQIPVEVAHTWDFTKWSEATIANLKAEAAKVTVYADPDKEGNTMCTDNEAQWTDHEKKPGTTCDTYAASKDNCFWAITTPDEAGQLSANGEAIAEFKGLAFNATYAASRALAIAVNYPSTSLGTYNGPSYLWFGGKGQEIMTIKGVKGGTQIKIGVESHKSTDARGVQLFVAGEELKDPEGAAVAAPTTYVEQTWAVPAGESVNVLVKNTNGCHIYFIDAEIDENFVDSISTVKTFNRVADGIYNLNGQKVNKAEKGLFIINGKKVVK